MVADHWLLEKSPDPGKIAIIIPARIGSTRLPGKMMLDQTGQPLIWHTYQAASKCKGVDTVAVATGDNEIAEAIIARGGMVIMTAKTCLTGTERVYRASLRLGKEIGIVINIQGDEPEIDPATIEAVINGLEFAHVVTVATPILNINDFNNRNVVKVVRDSSGNAMYFSRSPIPYREARPVVGGYGLRHVGVYGFHREQLNEIFERYVPTPLSVVESLEQLQWLELGHPVGVAIVSEAHRGIDTIDDYQKFVNRTTGQTRY